MRRLTKIFFKFFLDIRDGENKLVYLRQIDSIESVINRDTFVLWEMAKNLAASIIIFNPKYIILLHFPRIEKMK